MNGKFLFGLLLGIILAGGVAYYLNQAPTPYVDKGFNGVNNKLISSNSNEIQEKPLILAPGTKMERVETASDSLGTVDQPKIATSAPTYDFYEVLQGNKPLHINANKDASSLAINKPNGFLVQVGVFANAELANDMKARMALLGYNVKIKVSNVNDQLLYRVVIGELQPLDSAQALIAQLKKDDIQATLVK